MKFIVMGPVSLVLLVVRDIEELNLEARLGGSDHTEPVTKTRALKELLRQILEIALREGNRGLNPDLALALANNLHGVTELARTTIDLDTVMEELLESVGIKNTVVGRTGEVDEKAIALGRSLRGTRADNLVRLRNSHFNKNSAYCWDQQSLKEGLAVTRCRTTNPSFLFPRD